nr:hypothetical protein [Methylomarinum sp. Ch1-1]MDP4519086.1 hypothetical protein [Methylomarinum sp. Ch1-1]
MQNTLRLRLLKNAVLPEIHQILLTPSADEASKLQQICDKLAHSLSRELVWGGLLTQSNQLQLTSVSGKYKKHSRHQAAIRKKRCGSDCTLY